MGDRVCTAVLLAALAGLTGCESKKRAQPRPEPGAAPARSGLRHRPDVPAASLPKPEPEPPPSSPPPSSAEARRGPTGRHALDAGDAGGEGGPTDLVRPEVELVNKDYDRLKSRVLMRRIRRATKANLEFAAYDSNIMTCNPKRYTPTPPEEKVRLAELDFGGALLKDSLVDRLDETPLTQAEKRSPMAWGGLRDHLTDWNFQRALPLAEIGAEISDEKWNDSDVPVPYQEITRVYLHDAGEADIELWVRVEFKPWVEFLADVGDEDGDGFGEFYGKVPPEAVTAGVLKEVTGNYRGAVLSAKEAQDWAYKLSSDWYDRYATETLEKERLAGWPDEEARAECGGELTALGDERPTFVIEGRPFGKALYNILLVEGLEKK